METVGAAYADGSVYFYQQDKKKKSCIFFSFNAAPPLGCDFIFKPLPKAKSETQGNRLDFYDFWKNIPWKAEHIGKLECHPGNMLVCCGDEGRPSWEAAGKARREQINKFTQTLNRLI